MKRASHDEPEDAVDVADEELVLVDMKSVNATSATIPAISRNQTAIPRGPRI